MTMRLQFVSPLLHELDELEVETLVGYLWEDVRPAPGVAGLCDFRLGGRVSRLMMEGYVAGAFGESLLLPGRPALTFEKVLFIGAGPRAAFDEARFDALVAATLALVEGLATRSVVVELPGRQDDAIAPELAADRMLEALVSTRTRNATWTLVEDHAARRRIEQHMVEERRRVRPIR